MHRIRVGAWLVAIATMLVSGTVLARGGWRGSGGWGHGPYTRMYDPSRVVTVDGVVTRIDHVTPRRGMSAGVHLELKTPAETLAVHLGPAWFVERQDVRIEVNDRITVTGSKVPVNGKTAIIAREVKKGDATLTLRDESGRPVWAAWRGRPAG